MNHVEHFAGACFICAKWQWFGARFHFMDWGLESSWQSCDLNVLLAFPLLLDFARSIGSCTRSCFSEVEHLQSEQAKYDKCPTQGADSEGQSISARRSGQYHALGGSRCDRGGLTNHMGLEDNGLPGNQESYFILVLKVGIWDNMLSNYWRLKDIESFKGNRCESLSMECNAFHELHLRRRISHLRRRWISWIRPRGPDSCFLYHICLLINHKISWNRCDMWDLNFL